MDWFVDFSVKLHVQIFRCENYSIQGESSWLKWVRFLFSLKCSTFSSNQIAIWSVRLNYGSKLESLKGSKRKQTYYFTFWHKISMRKKHQSFTHDIARRDKNFIESSVPFRILGHTGRPIWKLKPTYYGKQLYVHFYDFYEFLVNVGFL